MGNLEELARGAPDENSGLFRTLRSSAKRGIHRILPRALSFRATATPIERLACFAGRHYPEQWPLRVIPFLVWEEWDKLDNTGLRFARLPDGAHVACRMNDWLWARMYLWGIWEPETTAFIRRWLRAGDTFLDIGANNGYFTSIAARIVGARGHVHAFEPNPEAFELLRLSAAASGADAWVTCNPTALGERDGEAATLHIHPDRWLAGQSSLLPYDRLSGGREVRVPVRTLDRYCADQSIETIRLMKMDIEGGEQRALAGGRDCLKQIHPDAIVCEVQSNELSADAPQVLLGVFESCGYQAHFIDVNGGLRRYDGSPLVARGLNLCFLAEKETRGLKAETSGTLGGRN